MAKHLLFTMVSSALLAGACGLASPNPAAAVVDVQHLERKVEALFRDADRLPVAISRPKDRIQVRTTFTGDCMISVAEVAHVDHPPDAFLEFLENFADAFPKVNPMARTVLPLEGTALKQAVKSVLKFPFPLTDRIMIHWKYLRLNRSPDEHMLILSEEGNQQLLQDHLTEEERDKYVLARTFLCVYWIRPVVCPQSGEVRGSSIRYAFSGDVGGTIPTWIQNQVGPKTALDSVVGLVNYVKQQQQKQ